MAFLYTKDTNRMDCYKAIKDGENEVIVSGEKTRLDGELFRYFKGLEKVELQEGVRVIDDRVFQYCSDLKTIIIADSVWDIGLQAFEDCTELTNVKMSANVKTLAYKCFKGCRNLSKIILPGLLKFSGSTVFEGCKKLDAVVAPNINLEKTIADYKPLLTGGFIEMPELFTEENATIYKKYILAQKAKLLSIWLKKDYVKGIAFLAENGAVTLKNFDTLYFLPAQEAKAKQCVAYLLDWKDKNISIDDELKAFSKELNRKPTELSAFKQLWKYDVFKDNTMALISYLGEDTEITIPEKVGKYTIFRLNNTVFCDCDGENIKKIFIPKTVTEIRPLVFECVPYATIYAPAGSYAENYARENDIPFVAEEGITE